MTLFVFPKRPKFWLVCGLIAALAPAAAASVRSPEPARQMIHDPRSGLAMQGYDPVAFHSDGRAIAGREQFTAEALGLVWRFASAANRDAFLETPDAYLPMFGGHDGAGVGDSRMVQGDPAIFLIAGGRTVFFRTTADRDAFAADPALRRKAELNWPQVVLDFAGH